MAESLVGLRWRFLVAKFGLLRFAKICQGTVAKLHEGLLTPYQQAPADWSALETMGNFQINQTLKRTIDFSVYLIYLMQL